MELNRSRVVPPRDLVDMIEKLRTGYYDVDTEVVHETYRVVTPAIPNGDVGLGGYINKECDGFPIYRLERMTSPGKRLPNVCLIASHTHSLHSLAPTLLALLACSLQEERGASG